MRPYDPFAAWKAGLALWGLAVQAQTVMTLRTMAMAGLVAKLPGEDRRMVDEKGPAFARSALAAGLVAARGGSPEAVMHAAIKPLHRATGANLRRLTRPARPGKTPRT